MSTPLTLEMIGQAPKALLHDLRPTSRSRRYVRRVHGPTSDVAQLAAMLGERLGSTARADMSLPARNRARISLRLEPIMNRSIGSPMRIAA